MPLLPASRSTLGSSDFAGGAVRLDRIIGLDIARFVAIIGMMATHVWLYADVKTDEVIWGSAQFEGRASALFAVLAGIGAVLSTRTPLSQGRRGRARWTLVGRGVALVVIGLTVAVLPNSISIILVYYGVMFFFLAALLTWPRWALVLTGIFIVLAAPVFAYLVGLAGNLMVTEAINPTWLSFGEPLEFVRGILVTGSFPVLIWLAYGIAGMLIGRALLAARTLEALRTLCLRLVITGGAIWLGGIGLAALAQHALGGVHGMASELGITDKAAQAALDESGIGRPLPDTPFTLLAAAAHHGTTLDLLVTIGFAVTTIGLLISLGTLLSPFARRILTPATRAGSAPLTVYTAHVLIVGAVNLVLLGKPHSDLTVPEYASIHDTWFLSSPGFYFANVVLALAIGVILAALGRRGPLETLVTWAGRRFSRLGAPPRNKPNTPTTSPAQ